MQQIKFWLILTARKQTTLMTTEQQIGNDLNTINLIMAIGSKSSKRKAEKQRKACFAEIAKMNKNDGLDNLTDDELLAQLCN